MARGRHPNLPAGAPRRGQYGQKDRRHIAVHEAGHAVVATLLLRPPLYIDIKRREVQGGVSAGVTNGGVVRNEDVAGKGRDAVLPILTMCMAGVAAERDVNPDATLEGSMDWRDAWRFAVMAMCDHVIKPDGVTAHISEHEQQAKEPALRQALADAVRQAEALVAEHRVAVRRVAELLLRRGRVTGDEIAAVVRAEGGGSA